jgi:acyl carrier protein
MSEQDLRDRLLAILSNILDEPPVYAQGADIFDDFRLDSLDQMEFLYAVEEEFTLKIDDETFEEQELRKFDRLVRYLGERLGG